MSTREEFTKRFPRYAECIENPQGHRRGKDLADAALAGFESGYQAATSRQEAKIKALVEALEQIKHSITQMQMPENDKRREVLLIQNTVAEALALAKETP